MAKSKFFYIDSKDGDKEVQKRVDKFLRTGKVSNDIDGSYWQGKPESYVIVKNENPLYKNDKTFDVYATTRGTKGEKFDDFFLVDKPRKLVSVEYVGESYDVDLPKEHIDKKFLKGEGEWGYSDKIKKKMKKNPYI